jgi:hypothetical protein
MANKFQALLALLGKNKQAQGQQTPVNSQYQGLAQMLPQLQDGLAGQLPRFDSNALAQRNGTVNLGQGGMNPNSTVSLNQGGINPQTHPLLAGIKQGANKAKHYLLDPVYNTPTGDATIDATDPNKFTDSRLGRYGALALLTGAGFATGQPALGAIAGAKMVGGMRQNDLKEYQARLGKKATADVYRQAGIQYNPLLDEKDQSKLTDLQIKNKERLAGLRLLANPNATAQYASNGQQKIVDPATGQVTYTAGVEATDPYAILADPSLLAGKQQREQQKQNQKAQQALAKERINVTKDYHNQQLLLGNKRLGLSQAQMAQQERHFQQTFGLSVAKFEEAKKRAKEGNPRALSERERLLKEGVITEQQYVNAVMGNPKDRRGRPINVPIQPRNATPNRTPQGGYQTSAGTLPAINITLGR